MFRTICFLAGFAVSVSIANAANLSIEEKVTLQAVMNQHIEHSIIDGIIPHVNLSNGDIVDLVPTKSHPMILSFGENYVLCTDFRDPKGEFINVDFYVTKKTGQYVIFQTEINNRDPLKKLMKAGKVAMIK